jgi:hypothetical protein
MSKLAIGAVLALAVQFAATPAYATGTSYDGTDPATTGCANSARVIWSTQLYNYTVPGDDMGEMEVMYSPTCVTNWVRIYINPGQGYTLTASKWIERPAGNGLPEKDITTNDTATGWSYGMQVYAPGCIYVQGMILTPVAMAAESGEPTYIC